MDELDRQIIVLVTEHLGIGAEDITLETPLEQLGDSLDVVELVMALEERFGEGVMKDADVAEIRTVGDLVEWIRRNRGDEDGGAGARVPRPTRPPEGGMGQRLDQPSGEEKD